MGWTAPSDGVSTTPSWHIDAATGAVHPITQAANAEASTISRRHDVLEYLEAFPGGLDGRASLARHIDGFLHHRELRNIARTVGKNVPGGYAHQRLRAGHVRHRRTVERQFGAPVDAQSAALFAHAHEEQADMRIDAEIAETLEHAVAVVIGKYQLIRRNDAHKSRRTALEGTIRPPFGIGGCKKEERSACDECLVIIRELGAMRFFDETVGERAAAETILQRTISRMIHERVPSGSGDPSAG